MAEAVQEKILESIPRFIIPEGKIQTLSKGIAAPETAKPPVTEAVTTPPEAPQPEVVEAKPEEKPEEKAEEQGKETTEKDQEKPSSRRFERRIDRAIRAKAEAQARAELLERELTELKAKSQPPVDQNEPQAKDFTDVEEYAKAKAKYASEKVIKEHESKIKAEAQKKVDLELTQNWEEQVSKVSAKYDDFDEVVGDIKPTSPALRAIMLADNGAEVAYHLAKNPKEAKKFTEYDAYRQVLEIGKLSTKLLQTPEAPKKPSKAPPPIAPVTGTGTVSDDTYEPGMSHEQYLKIRGKLLPRR